jgi:putative peptide zinc metalloprotease protein
MTLAPERPGASDGEPEGLVRGEPATAPLTVSTCERCPRLADGIELIGEYADSGFKQPPSLVRRADGQVIQLPELLYQVVRKVDGDRSYEEIARQLSDEIKRGLDADSVRFLVEEKLHPLGIVCGPDGTSPKVEKPDPFLGLKFRAAVVPEAVSGGLGTMFKPLFFPLIVVAVMGAFVVADWWLFGVHGVAQALRQSLYNPALFIPLFLAIAASAAFHEVGHAAGCRYGGGNPGKMGCGLYLAWPAFYTDVTDAYRLNRRSRLRTDLGGVYFNVVFVVATMGLYLVTRFEPLLLLIVVQHIEIAHQLLPVVRLDGYYIVADITGVPDLFARIGPILRSMIPGRKADERVTVLKPWVRRAVTLWVLVVVPLLVFELFMVLIHLPRIVGTAWDSGAKAYGDATAAFGDGETLKGLGSALQILLLAVPVVGILLVLAKTGLGGGRWVWRHTDGRPVARFLTVAVVGTLAGVLAYSWISPDNYKPIRPGERGTVTESVRAVRSLPNLPRVATPRGEEREVRDATRVTTTTEPDVTPTTQVGRNRAPAEEPQTTSTTVGRTTTTAGATTTTRPRQTTTTEP